MAISYITHVVRIREDGRKNVLHVIDPLRAPRYANRIKIPSDLSAPEAQMAVAEQLRNGWLQNGSDSTTGCGRITIEQYERGFGGTPIAPGDRLGRILHGGDDLVPRIPSAGGDPN